MNEEPKVIEAPAEVSSAELHDIVNAINQQSYKSEVDREEIENNLEAMNQLLTDLLTEVKSQKPTPEEVQQQTTNFETEQQALESINTQLVTMNTNMVALQEEMPKESVVVEGFYFVGLAVIITYAVYMFWNQLTKW